MTILQEAVASVLDRRAYYKEANDYYEGNVPEVFASARLRHAMRVTGDRSRLNFCRPIVDAVNDRMEIATIAADTSTGTKKIDSVWKNNDLGLEAQEIHRMALVNGDCFVMVWPDENGETQLSYNSPENMALVYDPENPRKKLYAVKLWKVSEKESRMNIYTATEIRKYKTNAGEVSEGTNWTATETIDNPWGEVPVFHFRTHRPHGRPEHYEAYDSQNAINKLFITNMNTIDYQGAPQRYALANLDSDVDSYDEDDAERTNLDALRNGPGELWYLKGVNMVGEFKPADAMAFWTPIEKIRDAIATLTGTPVHYLSRGLYTPIGNALRVSEAPLLQKIAQREMSFGYTWRDIFKFVLKVEGVSATDVVVTWKTHESLDELERWDVTLKKRNAGLSQKQALRENGYTEEEIDKILAERQEEEANNASATYQRAARVDVNNDETLPLNGANKTDGNGNYARPQDKPTN